MVDASLQVPNEISRITWSCILTSIIWWRLCELWPRRADGLKVVMHKQFCWIGCSLNHCLFSGRRSKQLIRYLSWERSGTRWMLHSEGRHLSKTWFRFWAQRPASFNWFRQSPCQRGKKSCELEACWFHNTGVPFRSSNCMNLRTNLREMAGPLGDHFLQ